ncbi:MAG: MFS transporter [Rhodospirillales bacterium]|jgi:MFS family permease|nr:MFS transporter [Rhodospirillales bacterium]
MRDFPSPVVLIAAMCVGLFFSVLGFAAFPALMPVFFDEWGLDNTEAGWVNGLYFLGYLLAVPALVGITDRIDTRRVFIVSLLVSTGAAFGFAAFAQGFWTASAFRVLAGVGLAGTFLPGMRLLVERLEGRTQLRAVAYFAAAFGIGASVSYVLAGEIESRFGWPWAFAATGPGPLVQIVIALVFVRGAARPPAAGSRPGIPNFRAVLANRRVMGYVLAGTGHLWELLAVRAWTVTFLVFALARYGDSAPPWRATTLAMIIGFCGVVGIVAGGELGVRFQRKRVLVIIMGLSAALASVIGFAAALPFWALMALFIVYGLLINADSSLVYAGTMAHAPEHLRGAAMAVHGTVSFIGGFAGPLIAGVVLDATGGGATVASWGFAFASAGLAAAAGSVLVAVLDSGPDEA